MRGATYAIFMLTLYSPQIMNVCIAAKCSPGNLDRT
jgi:hypothetical protein